MDTYMHLRAWGPEAEAALAELSAMLQRLDGQLSVTDPGSEIWAVNHAGGAPTALSGDAFTLLSRTLDFCAGTHGALDVTLYPVSRAWGFTTGDYRVPDPEELARLLPLVDCSAVTLDADARTVTLPPGAELDLGAAAKGYAGALAAELLARRGVRAAMLDLGSSTICLTGRKPDGSDWRIAVQDPEDPAAYAGVIACGPGSICTSGGYERYFIAEDGAVCWHILDPSTGRPAKAGLLSVTVLCPDALTGDLLSTALFVMGPERAADWWRAHGGFECILIDENRNILVTEGAADRFTPMGAYTHAELTVIGREE